MICFYKILTCQSYNLLKQFLSTSKIRFISKKTFFRNANVYLGLLNAEAMLNNLDLLVNTVYYKSAQVFIFKQSILSNAQSRHLDFYLSLMTK